MDLSDLEMDALNPHDPNGPPLKVRFAEGRLYCNKCAACGEYNGGGIDDGEHTPYSGPFSPCNEPCLYCSKGPVRPEYVDESQWRI